MFHSPLKKQSKHDMLTKEPWLNLNGSPLDANIQDYDHITKNIYSLVVLNRSVVLHTLRLYENDRPKRST